MQVESGTFQAQCVSWDTQGETLTHQLPVVGTRSHTTCSGTALMQSRLGSIFSIRVGGVVVEPGSGITVRVGDYGTVNHPLPGPGAQPQYSPEGDYEGGYCLQGTGPYGPPVGAPVWRDLYSAPDPVPSVPDSSLCGADQLRLSTTMMASSPYYDVYMRSTPTNDAYPAPVGAAELVGGQLQPGIAMCPNPAAANNVSDAPSVEVAEVPGCQCSLCMELPPQVMKYYRLIWRRIVDAVHGTDGSASRLLPPCAFMASQAHAKTGEKPSSGHIFG